MERIGEGKGVRSICNPIKRVYLCLSALSRPSTSNGGWNEYRPGPAIIQVNCLLKAIFATRKFVSLNG